MTTKVVKFGGSSLANAVQVRKAIAIVQADPARKIVVVSAPGKRTPYDKKVTDQLYLWNTYKHGKHHEEEAAIVWEEISDRFSEIVQDLGLSLDIGRELASIQNAEGASADDVASRGEYLMAKILAEALGYEFVDAAEIIRLNSVKTDKGHLPTRDKLYNEPLTHSLVHERLKDRCAVVPGFYGTLLDHKTIKTFPRNSSDISAAIIAAALPADEYEKFTDVSGMLVADNRVVHNPRSITSATYRELGELAIDPTGVFHPEAMYPVQAAGIVTTILNLDHPEGGGTIIYPDSHAPQLEPGTVIGIAARTGFSVITLYKAAMNREVGFMRRVLEVLEHEGLSFEHAPMGRDIVNVILESKQVGVHGDHIKERLYSFCNADEVKIENGLALISTVGRAMRDTAGVAARLFDALARANVSSRVIDQGATEMNIVVGVAERDCNVAVNAIYDEFFPSR